MAPSDFSRYDRIAEHWRGGTHIRRVYVVKVEGDTATVRGMFGLMQGCEYQCPVADLHPPPRESGSDGA